MTAAMNHILTSEFTEEEVKQGLDAIGDLKAPGVDGMSSLFYKKHWEIVREAHDYVYMMRVHVCVWVRVGAQCACVCTRPRACVGIKHVGPSASLGPAEHGEFVCVGHQAVET